MACVETILASRRDWPVRLTLLPMPVSFGLAAVLRLSLTTMPQAEGLLLRCQTRVQSPPARALLRQAPHANRPTVPAACLPGSLLLTFCSVLFASLILT